MIHFQTYYQILCQFCLWVTIAKTLRLVPLINILISGEGGVHDMKNNRGGSIFASIAGYNNHRWKKKRNTFGTTAKPPTHCRDTHGLPLLSTQKALGFWVRTRSAGILAQEPPATHTDTTFPAPRAYINIFVGRRAPRKNSPHGIGNFSPHVIFHCFLFEKKTFSIAVQILIIKEEAGKFHF